MHSVAGRLYAGPGILLGADSPPVIFLASFFNIFLFYFLIVASLWLAAFSWSGNPEAWSLKLGAIDHDPWTELRPGIRHDLELSRDGLQLARACVGYFYFEFFHQCFLLTFRPCCTTNHSALKSFIDISLISWASDGRDLFTCFTSFFFISFIISSYIISGPLSTVLGAWGLELFSFFNFFII